MESKFFKTWNNINSRQRNDRVVTGCFISFGSNGHIILSQAVTEAMELDKDSRLIFLEGLENDSEWFVCKVKENGLSLRINKSRNQFQIYGTTLAKRILTLCNTEKRTRVRMETVSTPLPKDRGLPAVGFRLFIDEARNESGNA